MGDLFGVSFLYNYRPYYGTVNIRGLKPFMTQSIIVRIRTVIDTEAY